MLKKRLLILLGWNLLLKHPHIINIHLCTFTTLYFGYIQIRTTCVKSHEYGLQTKGPVCIMWHTSDCHYRYGSDIKTQK